MTTSRAFSDALAPGSVVGSYVLLGLVGRGGFGVVYKGSRSTDGKIVAIKEFFPSELAVRHRDTVQPNSVRNGAAYNDCLRRFRQEAQKLIAFRDCETIVTCLELVEANGTAYIVMEYVDGTPLNVLLRSREVRGHPFTEIDLLRVILPLLQGLQVLHASKVYHRDIKPSNIIVRHADDQPVLIDFGSAKQATSGYTKSLAPLTDGYAALEQTADEGSAIGPWTDLYGVGAVMWRMVAGGAASLQGRIPVSVQSRAAALIQGTVDPLPPAQSIGAGRFSHELLTAIDDCLVLSAADRVQSSEVLLAQIDRAPGQPETGSSLGDELGPQPVAKNGRRSWRRYSPALAGLVVLVAIAIVISISRSGETEVSDEAVAGMDVSKGDHAVLGPPQFFSMVAPFDLESKFTLGSHADDVRGIMGTPTNVDKDSMIQGIETWSYGSSTVTIGYKTRMVTAWDNNGALPVELNHDYTSGALFALPEFTYGSTADEVLRAMGTPTNIMPKGLNGWMYYWYGNSHVMFDQLYRDEAQVKQWQIHDVELKAYALLNSPGGQPITGFAIGSTLSEAYRYIEAPNTDFSANGHLGEATFWFDRSSVTVNQRTLRVTAWNNSGGNLRVRVLLTDRTYPDASDFARGSTREEVFAVMGIPIGISVLPGVGETWQYGQSSVTFDRETRRVRDWSNKQGDLPILLSPGSHVDLSAKSLTLASSSDEVVSLLGTPAELSTNAYTGLETWMYGRSTITIDGPTQVIVGWDDKDEQLPVELFPEYPVSSAVSTFTMGASMDEVLSRMGTPTTVESREWLGDVYWGYGRNSLFFEFQTRRLRNWSNRTGTLPVDLKPAEPVGRDVGTLTLGSSMDEILQLLGTPSRIWHRDNSMYGQDEEVELKYDGSMILLDMEEQAIKAWDNVNGNIPVLLLPTRPVGAEITTLSRNSTMDEVLYVMGTPTRNSTTWDGLAEWGYGLSVIWLNKETRRVVRWDNRGGNLRL